MLNFIIETGFRNPGIRNPEITRVYNAVEMLEGDDIGIRNPETTRVYNLFPSHKRSGKVYATWK